MVNSRVTLSHMNIFAGVNAALGLDEPTELVGFWGLLAMGLVFGLLIVGSSVALAGFFLTIFVGFAVTVPAAGWLADRWSA